MVGVGAVWAGTAGLEELWFCANTNALSARSAKVSVGNSFIMFFMSHSLNVDVGCSRLDVISACGVGPDFSI